MDPESQCAPVPVPVTATDCGLPPPVSLTSIVALRAPDAVEVKVTVILRLFLPPRVLGGTGQALLAAKSAGLAPPTLMPVTVSGVEPLLFCTDTVCGELALPTVTEPKDNDAGENETIVPYPVKLAVCGLGLTPSATFNIADRIPVRVGVKTTEIVQLVPGGNVAGAIGQLLVWLKSDGFAPAMLMVLICTAAFV